MNRIITVESQLPIDFNMQIHNLITQRTRNLSEARIRRLGGKAYYQHT